ncbi:hypothetical protein Tco_0591253 [Tanacetum coccineum]
MIFAVYSNIDEKWCRIERISVAKNLWPTRLSEKEAAMKSMTLKILSKLEKWYKLHEDYQVYLGKYELGDEHRKRWNEIKDVTTKQETGFSYNESLYAGETYKSAERWLNKTNDHANVFGGSFKWFSRILDDSGEVMSISLQLKLDLSSSRVHHSSKRIFQGITPNKVAGRHSMDLG